MNLPQSYSATMYILPQDLPRLTYLRAYEVKDKVTGGVSFHAEKTDDIYKASFFRPGASDQARAKLLERAFPNAKKIRVQITRTIVIDEGSMQ